MSTGRKLLETTTYPSLQKGSYLETDIKIQNIYIKKLRISQNFRYKFVSAPFFRHVWVVTFYQDKDPNHIKWNYIIQDTRQSRKHHKPEKAEIFLLFIYCFNCFIMVLALWFWYFLHMIYWTIVLICHITANIFKGGTTNLPFTCWKQLYNYREGVLWKLSRLFIIKIILQEKICSYHVVVAFQSIFDMV